MNITVRNIPEEIIKKIRTLSQMEKRSLNNEILIILERGVQKEVKNITIRKKNISRETQVSIWKKLSNEWDDQRSTKEIIDDIYDNRTHGREVKL
jgi:plasmid stability protein